MTIKFYIKHKKKFKKNFLRDPDSAEYNLKSVQILKQCLSSDDLHYLVSKSNYGIFLKMIGKINDAISVLLEVVNKMSKFNLIMYLVHPCFII